MKGTSSQPWRLKQYDIQSDIRLIIQVSQLLCAVSLGGTFLRLATRIFGTGKISIPNRVAGNPTRLRELPKAAPKILTTNPTSLQRKEICLKDEKRTQLYHPPPSTARPLSLISNIRSKRNGPSPPFRNSTCKKTVPVAVIKGSKGHLAPLISLYPHKPKSTFRKTREKNFSERTGINNTTLHSPPTTPKYINSINLNLEYFFSRNGSGDGGRLLIRSNPFLYLYSPILSPSHSSNYIYLWFTHRAEVLQTIHVYVSG